MDVSFSVTSYIHAIIRTCPVDFEVNLGSSNALFLESVSLTDPSLLNNAFLVITTSFYKLYDLPSKTHYTLPLVIFPPYLSNIYLEYTCIFLSIIINIDSLKCHITL